MIKVIFVCHGNICRSPMAEFVFKDMVKKRGVADCFYIESAATSAEEIGNDMHYGSREKLRREGVPFERRRARQITRGDCEAFDYIIVMDSHNIRNLERAVGTKYREKTYRLLDFTARRGRDIADPWYTGDFEATYRDIVEGCEGLLSELA